MKEVKTTCVVKHRDYVPDGWIAIDFCEIYFSGHRSDDFEEQWRKIEYEKYDAMQEKIKPLELERLELKKQLTDITQQINIIKKKRSLFHTYSKEIRQLYTEFEDAELKIKEVKHKIKKLKNNRFYKTRELIVKINDFLEEKGFHIISSSSKGGECSTEKDIWLLDYN